MLCMGAPIRETSACSSENPAPCPILTEYGKESPPHLFSLSAGI